MTRPPAALALKGALTLIALLVLAACGPVYQRPGVMGSVTEAVAGPDVSANERLRIGEGVFYANCHGCHPHGGAGLGRGVTDRPVPDFLVRLQVRNGFGEMPAFGPEEIDPTELDALLAYLRELRRFWAQTSE